MTFSAYGFLRTAAPALLLASPLLAGQPNALARQAFDSYVAKLEDRLARQHSRPDTYLTVLNLPAPMRAAMEGELRGGAMPLQAVEGGPRELKGGLLHHWRGAAFVPRAHASDMFALLRDYRDLPSRYRPQVESCRVLSHNSETAVIALRMRMRRVVTVVLDGEYDVRTASGGEGRGYGISRSIRLRQIDDAGTPSERTRAEGKDDGFLWRLNSYWSFMEVNGGLAIELEAVSLTRDIPVGLGWLVQPAIAELPRESLEFTLRATVHALAASAAEEAHR